jgi:uncharacterized phage protein (TIGR01671 family)
MIKNTIYKGKRSYSGEFYNCPLIIEPNQWQKVNDNLENNRNNSGKKVEHKYLLKGLLKCCKCGRNYYGHSRINGKDNTYICSSRRHKDMICNNKGIFIPFIEGLVWRQMFNDKLFLKAYLDFISNNNNSAEVKEIECYIKDINNKTIFAGDIVNYKYEKYDERNDVPYLASHVGKVELVGCLCSFRIKPICNVLETCRANSLSLTEPDKADNEYIEIIGNIHNNPELLDEQ